MDGPRYDLLAEFSSGAGDDYKKLQFLRSFEEELRRHDREYDYARNAQLLKSPVLKVVSRGSFEKFRSKRISEGAQEGQFKAPHLTSDNEFERNFSIEKTISILD